MQGMKDAGIMFRLIMGAIERRGLNAAQIMRRLGVDDDYLNSRGLRTPHRAQAIFWQLLEEMTGDPDIGLHLGQSLPMYRGQVLEYLFLSSRTFGDGLKRSLSYQRLISDAAQSRLVVEADSCYLVLETAAPDIRRLRHFNECFIQGMISFFAHVTEGRFKPLRIDFDHERRQGEAEVAAVLGCPVRFAQPESRLVFSPEVLTLASPHFEPDLLALHEQHASDQVARLAQQDVVGEVERVLAEVLESGGASLDEVADRLGLRTRLLRSRLHEAGTSFNQILGDFRYRLARHLLSRTNESIDEIVYLTGFSEPSTFYRAFRRWSGMTPIDYRKQRSA